MKFGDIAERTTGVIHNARQDPAGCLVATPLPGQGHSYGPDGLLIPGSIPAPGRVPSTATSGLEDFSATTAAVTKGIFNATALMPTVTPVTPNTAITQSLIAIPSATSAALGTGIVSGGGGAAPSGVAASTAGFTSGLVSGSAGVVTQVNPGPDFTLPVAVTTGPASKEVAGA
ncbi:hypothetical protein HDU93_007871, partial [Gonapodya sp. JEL0774]